MEDKETQQIAFDNKELWNLTQQSGWKLARKILVDKILSLQTVAEYSDIITTGNATKLLKEMKANARCAEILFSWLREIEGGAQQAVDSIKPTRKSPIVKLE